MDGRSDNDEKKLNRGRSKQREIEVSGSGLWMFSNGQKELFDDDGDEFIDRINVSL